MLYLELGLVPIRFIIVERRLNFLWYILHEDSESLIHMVLKKQLETPVPGDWGQACIKNLEELGIRMSMKDIENSNEESFRSMIRMKIEEIALDHLNKLKMKHSKVLHITHPRLEMQEYLKANDHNVQESKFLFALRSRMVDVRANYREKYFVTICPCCHLEEDSQEHLLICYKLEENRSIVRTSPNYQDLFCSDVTKQLNISRILRTKFLMRKKKKNHSI